MTTRPTGTGMTTRVSKAPPPGSKLVLREIDGSRLRSLETRAARLALWINTYNALVADAIVALGLRHTVWEVPDFFDRICCRVGEDVVSASDIEHGVLRGNRPHPLVTSAPFAAEDSRRGWAMTPLDPRIHCAISCGARSCPPVRVYEAARLDGQLDLAAHGFVNREVTLDGERLVVTELFRWFGSDFAEDPDGLGGFLLRYLEEGPTRRALQTHGLEDVAWRPYDWRLEPPARGQGSGA